MRELLLGLSIGLGAGVSPGPLLALVISASLRHGGRAGLRVAASPLITDAPIVALALTVVGLLPGRVLTAIGVVGAVVVGHLGVSAVRAARRTPPAVPEPAPPAVSDAPAAPGDAPAPADPTAGAPGDATVRSLRDGVLVNLLSPHPWLFWLSVGGPLLVTAWRHGAGYAGAFLAGFYAMLVGSKAVLAALLGASRHRLTARWHRRLVLASAGLLLAAAVAMAAEFVPALVTGG